MLDLSLIKNPTDDRFCFVYGTEFSRQKTVESI